MSHSYNGGELLATGEDNDGCIEVVDLAGMRALHFSSAAIQSLLDPQAPECLQLDYTAVMSLAMLMHSQPQRVLLIGLGGGALVHFIYHYFPSVQIDVIEKRRAVIQLAKEYFLLPDDGRIQLYCGDAQLLVRELTGQYEVIFNDAYSGHGPDISLYANDVHQQIFRLLSDGGVLVSNLWQRRTDENQMLITDLRRLLPAMAYHKDEEGRNLILFAARRAWSRSLLKSESLALARQSGQPFDVHHQGLSYGVKSLGWRLRLQEWMGV